VIHWAKRWVASMLVLLLVVASSGCGGKTESNVQATAGSAGIQERTIKAGIGLNEDHPQGQALKKFKEIVEEKTGGKIKVQTYFSAQLGDDLKMVEALKAGTQEITIPSTSPLVGTIKEFGIFDFPFLFRDPKEADAVLDGPLGQKLLDLLPQHGLVGLAYWENGFRNLTNSRHPVETVEDFKGLKIRTMQNKVHIDAFQALGANPVPMPFSEVFSALESKTVDGQENPLATIESNKYYEVQKYLTITNHVYTPFVFLVSKKFWDQLSEEEKQILKEAAVEAGKYQRELNRQKDQEALENLKQKGMIVNELPEEERKKAAEIIKPVLEKYTKEFGEELVKQLYDELDKIRGGKS